MSNVIEFPSREKLGLSAAVSQAVIDKCGESFQQGYAAFLAGKFRRRPSHKSECFDANSWLLGWDEAAKNEVRSA